VTEQDDKPDRVPGDGSRVPSDEREAAPLSPGAEAEPLPPELACPDCGDPLVHVRTEISSGAFRTQAASMPQIPVVYFDCPECGTCWKFGTRLLPDPVRQTLRG
jgi:hypothetical protein